MGESLPIELRTANIISIMTVTYTNTEREREREGERERGREKGPEREKKIGYLKFLIVMIV